MQINDLDLNEFVARVEKGRGVYCLYANDNRTKTAIPKSTETVKAASGGTPDMPRPKTIAPSRTPQPFIEIGSIETRITGGTMRNRTKISILI